MAAPRVLLVELDGLLSMHLTRRLGALEVEVKEASAVDAVDRLAADPPELAVVNLALSQGSGFGLVNRVRRMDALAGVKLVVVADNATEAAIAAHRSSGTPADAYVSRVPDISTAAFADVVLEALQALLTDHLPEAADADLVPLDDAPDAQGARPDVSEVIAELGYRVLRRLPDEDGGAVFACMDSELDRAVAIKLIPDAEREDDERLQRFQRERRILALLHSPYVVGVYGAGTHRGIPYLVRELIDGEDLERRIRRDGPLDVESALRRVRETALGLKDAADAGIIHRDVRPANIHVENGRAKLARFGMGRREEGEPRITRDRPLLPDLVYVAPERVRGQEDVRSDIYSLGVTLHTLIAGAPPFSRTTPIDPLTGARVETPISLDAARAGTPPKVSALVSRLIAEDPARRPQRWDEVIALLDDVLQGSPREGGAGDEEEPTAVHGTLRLMGVVEIVQSLEMATKTATVTLQAQGGPEGKLAFEDGRLVHAAVLHERGEDAFFTLVRWKRGAFRVEYDDVRLEHNIDTPTAGLLLEAARREDEAQGAPSPVELHPASPAPIPEERALVVEASLEPRFFAAGELQDDASSESAKPPESSGIIDVEHVTEAPLLVERRPARTVSTAWGLVAVALVSAGAIYGGMQLPSLLPAPVDTDDAALAAMDELLTSTRAKLALARAELAAMEPKLAEYESARATKESLFAATRTLAAEVHANVEAALRPELSARRLQLRLSDDGTAAVLEVSEGALFDGEGDVVRDDGKTALARITGAIASLKDVHVRVEGHTDDTPPSSRSTHRNNWGLSGARALAVAAVLTEQGLAKDRVSALALADTKPVASNRGPKGRARNRRVEIHLTPQVDEKTLAATAAPAAP